jgi:hypothetical protein
MNRVEAVKLFGHYHVYSFTTNTIYEVLGRPVNSAYGKTKFSDPKDEFLHRREIKLLEELNELHAKYDNIFQWFKKPAVALRFHRVSKRELQRFDEYNKEKAALSDKIISVPNREDITLKHLPEKINMPVILDIGQKLYAIDKNYFNNAATIKESKIIERTLGFGSNSKGNWDYVFRYEAANDEGTYITFRYNFDNLDTHELKTDNKSMRYFLTLEAAEEAAQKIITRAKKEAAEIESERQKMRAERQARHEALMTAPGATDDEGTLEEALSWARSRHARTNKKTNKIAKCLGFIRGAFNKSSTGQNHDSSMNNVSDNKIVRVSAHEEKTSTPKENYQYPKP